MSVPAPTTYDVLLGRAQNGIDGLVLRFLDASDQKMLERVSKAFRARIQAGYLNQYPMYPDLLAGYNSSQERGPQESRKSYFQKRAVSLAKRTTGDVYGGRMVRHRATGFLEASLFHPHTQAYLAEFRSNCRVIGLLAFLQKIGAAEEMLQEVKRAPSNRKKYTIMKQWIVNNPQHVASLVNVAINGYCRMNLNEIANSMQEGHKILVSLPEEIGDFTELESLSINYNALFEIPEALRRTKIESLEARGNFFQDLPPPIPTLRSLYLTQNHYRFGVKKIDLFIRSFIANEGQSICIYLDETEYEDLKNENFIADIKTHEVFVELKNGVTILTVSSLELPLTQPLELP